jgi:hypothetical protein
MTLSLQHPNPAGESSQFCVILDVQGSSDLQVANALHWRMENRPHFEHGLVPCSKGRARLCRGVDTRRGPLSAAIPRVNAGGLKPKIPARTCAPASVATARHILSKILGPPDLGPSELEDIRRPHQFLPCTSLSQAGIAAKPSPESILACASSDWRVL